MNEKNNNNDVVISGIQLDAISLMDTVGRTIRELSSFSVRHKSTIQDDLFLAKVDDIILDLKQVCFKVVRYIEDHDGK